VKEIEMTTNRAGLVRAAVAAAVLCITASAVAHAAVQYTQFRSPEMVKALSDDSLSAAAEKTSDPQTLYGLAWFAGPATRAAILDKMVHLSPGDAPAAAALKCYDRIDSGQPKGSIGTPDPHPQDVESWIKADPDNGLPLSLKAYLTLRSGGTSDALEILETALSAKKFEAYDNRYYRKGILSALDALELRGETRVYALSEAISSRVNPGVYSTLASLSQDIHASTGTMSAQERGKVADMLLALATRLSHENGTRREGSYCSYMLLEAAYNMKASVTDDKDTKQAYELTAGAVGMSMQESWLQREDLYMALFYAERTIYGAAGGVGSAYYDALPATEKAQVDAAQAKLVADSHTLVSILAANPDQVAGLAVVENMFEAVVAMEDVHPEVLAALKNVLSDNEAVQNLLDLSAPHKSQRNLMRLGIALIDYAGDHDNTFPKDLSALKNGGYLAKSTTTVSPITGRPYVLVAPGMVLSRDSGNAPIAYDDAPLKNDLRITLFGDGHSGFVSAADIAKQAQGKTE
jgi:hypothetical protein